MRRVLPAACLSAVVWALLTALARGRNANGELLHERSTLRAARIADERKSNHDLRGHLSAVLMAAERLSGHADPAVARMGTMIVDRVDSMTQSLRR